MTDYIDGIMADTNSDGKPFLKIFMTDDMSVHCHQYIYEQEIHVHTYNLLKQILIELRK